MVSKSCPKKRQIPILDVALNDTIFFSVNFYDSNSESDQLCPVSTLHKLLEKINDFDNKNIIFGGACNLIFDSKYAASGGNSVKKPLAKLI